MKTSLVGGVVGESVEISASVPLMNVLDQVNDVVKSRPWEKRLVALACSESYQLSPTGAQCMFVIPPNCGKGRKDCDTSAVEGNPEYGRPLKPR